MYVFLEVALDALGIGVSEESHLEGIGFREDSDEDCFVCAEAFHCGTEGLGVNAGIADCRGARIVSRRREGRRAISSLLRWVLSLGRVACVLLWRVWLMKAALRWPLLETSLRRSLLISALLKMWWRWSAEALTWRREALLLTEALVAVRHGRVDELRSGRILLLRELLREVKDT